ncbi:MAG: hypothetical protein RIQ60_983 [Pseudomonadota bacterium]|jgi:hypothetical protein
MNTTRKLAHAALLAAGFLAAPIYSAACTANQAKPFTSGPLDAQGMFSEWVVDSNGIGLQICNVSVTNDGAPPPCFYDPPVPNNALSQALGRGNEAFLFLANSVFTTTGAAPVDAVIVMGLEEAFLSAAPQAGFQTQFQRLRTRLNVNAVGHYTVETPWRTTTYTVDALLPPGNGQNRAEVSDPIDITFAAGASVPGMVAPFLVASPEIPGFGKAQGYIGDGLTLTTVSGSPCNTNYVQITAVGLDGITPIDIGGNVRNAAGQIQANVYRNDQFTVMGKLAPVHAVPLSIGNAYYTRNAGADTVMVMAEGSTSASEQASMTVQVGTASTALAKESIRFFGTTGVTGALPATISVTATDPGIPSIANTQTATLTDLVTITTAQADCTGTGALRQCTLTVNASSSDDGSGGAVTLTVAHSNTPVVNGAAVITGPGIPAAVTVSSSNGGIATRNVTVVNH